jgi:prepilin signal peptidase PulO-like enzyme (type II secretory pathway)
MVTLLLLLLLVSISIFDARFFLIPNTLITALFFLGLFAIDFHEKQTVLDHVAALLGGYLIISGLSFIHSVLRGTEGLGGGDAKLLAALGWWVGLVGLPSIIFWATISAFGSILLMAFRGKEVSPKIAIPFGPHLSLGGFLVWLLGPITPLFH